MLDVSMVDSETGQTIWFYRWLNQKDTSTLAFANFLLHCKPRGCHKGKELNFVDQDSSRQNDQKSKSSEKRSSEIENNSTNASPSSEEDAEYFNLLKDVTADFVKRFSSGQ